MISLNVNTRSVVKFTNILERLHKSALPSAARNTLNDAVYDVKTRTMPEEARKDFTQRQKNFFTANSKFQKAEGFDLKSMSATVGFYENRLHRKSTNYAVKDLEQQEKGGKIGGKAFIPMRQARLGGKGVVKAQHRMTAIKKVIDARKVRSISGHSAGKLLRGVRVQKLIRAAIKARELNGDNAYILGNPNAGGVQTLFKVAELWTGTRRGGGYGSRKLKMTLLPLYRYKRGRSVAVSPTGFMKDATLKTADRLDDFYVKQAQRQVQKYYGRL